MNKKNTVLIVTTPYDPHVDVVIEEFNRRKVPVFRLHIEDLFLKTLSSVRFSGGVGEFRITNTSSSKTLHSSEILSVWWRHPKPIQFAPRGELDPFEEKVHHKSDKRLTIKENAYIDSKSFRVQEFITYINGLLFSLDCLFISKINSIRDASFKPEQLFRAQKMGFRIPETIIGTDPTSIFEFFHVMREQQKKIIYKVMTNPFIVDRDEIVPLEEVSSYQSLKVLTTDVSDIELDSLATLISIPCTFQEYVEKAFELRVTVIGDAVFPAAIHSQAAKSTALDWRTYAEPIPYTRAVLDDSLSEQIVKFVKSYDLNYSALDLIVTPENQVVFLENNPVGQFYFVQQKVPSLKIMELLIECLSSGSMEPSKNYRE